MKARFERRAGRPAKGVRLDPAGSGGSGTVDVPILAAPPSASGMGDVVDRAERARVFEALFQVRAEPERLGRFEVRRTLGRGAMGTVLEAFDPKLEREVAVKVLRQGLGGSSQVRLIREAQALASLAHPNVVQVYEIEMLDDGQLFIVMELVRGRSLADWQKDPRLGWQERVRAYLQAGAALAAAHRRGLVHRDFKPSNAMIGDDGRVRVLDFGLVGEAESDEDTSPAADRRGREWSLTCTGTVLGTPAYMPLEQVLGRQADARSDQFSFCVSLYEALFGERPFDEGSTVTRTVALRTLRLRPTPRGARVPRAIRDALQRGLARDPCQRWPSMDALLAKLEWWLAPRWGARWMLGVLIIAMDRGKEMLRSFGWVAIPVAWLLLSRCLASPDPEYARAKARVLEECKRMNEQRDTVWNDDVEQQVEQAILATGVPYARDTWPHVRMRLDVHALHWTRTIDVACGMASVQERPPMKILDLQLACARERGTALREVVQVLSAADEVRVETAVDVVSALPSPATCDDVEALRADPPARGEAVAELQARLDRARVLRAARAYGDAVGLLDEVVRSSSPRPPEGVLRVEALLVRSEVRGDMAMRSDEEDEHDAVRLQAAEADAERAYFLAVEQGYDAERAKAAAQLVSIVGMDPTRAAEALRWGRAALASTEGRPDRALTEAETLEAIGHVLREQQRYEEASSHLRRALAIKEERLGSDHLDVGRSLADLGAVLAEQGSVAESLAHRRRALEIMERALGRLHPRAVALRDVIEAMPTGAKMAP